MNFRVRAVFVLVFLFLVLSSKHVLAQARSTPPSSDPDIDIRLRGWNDSSGINPGLINHPENTDILQPQLSSSFSPNFTGFFQVHQRGGGGADGSPAGLATIGGVAGAIKAPVVGRSIGGGFNYVILYATGGDIVIHNGVEDSVATGYTIHFLNISVNPELRKMYEDNEAAGRKQLVAIPCGYNLGAADGDPLVTIRDTGSFMDIRFRDWWESGLSGGCANVPPGFANIATVGSRTFTPKEIPCDATTDDEYHNLRPYPASPCNKKIEETALMCGNNLVVKRIFEVTQGEAQSCADDANGTKICKYAYSGLQANVAINLKDAELPILGNTENVANFSTTESEMDLKQRMNQYVSWYLNGAVNMPFEDDRSILNSAEIVERAINYAGPLNKLLPWRVKMGKRIEQVNEALIGTVRHNQVALCSSFSGKGVPIPCNTDLKILQKLFGVLNRFSDWNSHRPPWEELAKSLPEYWKSFVEWRGGHCTPSVLGFYVCDLAFTGGENFFSEFISYLLPSSTEDRKGEVVTDSNSVETGKRKLQNTVQFTGGGQKIENVYFTTTQSKRHDLYFAHTQEVSEQAKLLQGTFAAKSEGANNWEAGIAGDSVNYENLNGCEKQEVRTNPGDNLYGDLEKDSEQKIEGTLTYDASFTCEFKNQGPDQSCLSACSPVDISCRAKCAKANVCSADVFASMAIYTKTPKVNEIWDRLVNGQMGVFKRFFPKVGPGSPLAEIKDIPGVTTASYSVTEGGEALAGDPTKLRSGANAQLFFPHLGGLEEYFLKGIQKALRPKDLSGNESISGQENQCNPKDVTHTNEAQNSSRRITQMSDGAIALALKVSRYTCTPAEVLVGVLAQETGGKTVTGWNPTTEAPITGSPNQSVSRTQRCFDGDLSDPRGCGPYSWTPFSNYQGQYKNFQEAAKVCMDALGVNSSLDQRIIGQAMCITSAKFWESIRDSDKSLPVCSSDNRKAYILDQVSPEGVRLALLHFCGAGEGATCDSYITIYNSLISGYKTAVSRVRGEVSSCQQ